MGKDYLTTKLYNLSFTYISLIIVLLSMFFLNIKNTIDQTKFNLDLFSSYREQDLPGPRVKGGAVYNYHFCNRYEDSKTAKHIGGSFAANGDTCNTDHEDLEIGHAELNHSFEKEMKNLNDEIELLGQKAYDYVRELSQHGMIMRRRDGNTRRLTTTRRFSEAFGCPHTDLRKVRKWFREQVTEAGMFDGMESEALKEVGEDGLVQSTLPFEDE